VTIRTVRNVIYERFAFAYRIRLVSVACAFLVLLYQAQLVIVFSKVKNSFDCATERQKKRKLFADTCQTSVKHNHILNYFFVLLEIPLNGLCDSRYECLNGGLSAEVFFFFFKMHLAFCCLSVKVNVQM